jgi:uncharacterized alpha-E superfamily protein
MLSRVADALFWMSRYLERAEQVARLLNVCFQMEMDLRGLISGPRELHWTSLAATLQQKVPPPEENASSPQAIICSWLTYDLDNASSIMSCVNRARNNARSIRGTITSEMWKELNKLYWKLRDPEFSRQATESPQLFYQTVESGHHIFQGVCDATLTHDEGWQFIQLGKFLERADKTLRILDIQYHLLQELANPADLPLSNIQWAGVLRSCCAHEAYQKLYVGRVDPERVVAFLLLHPYFPRSVRFCLDAAAHALGAIEGSISGRGESKADLLLGRVLSDLKFAELDQILKGDLHGFLGGVLERCAQVSLALQERYSLR